MGVNAALKKGAPTDLGPAPAAFARPSGQIVPIKTTKRRHTDSRMLLAMIALSRLTSAEDPPRLQCAPSAEREQDQAPRPVKKARIIRMKDTRARGHWQRHGPR